MLWAEGAAADQRGSWGESYLIYRDKPVCACVCVRACVAGVRVCVRACVLAEVSSGRFPLTKRVYFLPRPLGITASASDAGSGHYPSGRKAPLQRPAAALAPNPGQKGGWGKEDSAREGSWGTDWAKSAYA